MKGNVKVLETHMCVFKVIEYIPKKLFENLLLQVCLKNKWPKPRNFRKTGNLPLTTFIIGGGATRTSMVISAFELNGGLPESVTTSLKN